MVSDCSLNYDTETDTGDTVPELIFSKAQIKSYTDQKLKVQLQAAKLEQYKNNTIFAKQVSFSTFTDNLKKETEGNCNLISIDQTNEEYTMIGNVKILDIPNNLNILAENLHWNGKTEQLTSGKTDIITVSKNNIKISGTGLSASSVSGNFLFTGKVYGCISENEKSKDTSNEQTN